MNPNWNPNAQGQPPYQQTGWPTQGQAANQANILPASQNPVWGELANTGLNVQGSGWGQNIPAGYQNQYQSPNSGMFVMQPQQYQPQPQQYQQPPPQYTQPQPPTYQWPNSQQPQQQPQLQQASNGWQTPARLQQANDFPKQQQQLPPSNSTTTNSQIKTSGEVFGVQLSKDVMIMSALDGGMCADVSLEESTANRLVLWKKNGQANQRFRLVQVGQRFKIVCLKDNSALEIEKNSSAKGAFIVARPNTDNLNQLFQLIEVKPKHPDEGFYIRTFSGKCWDLCEWKTSQGTPIMQYDFNGGKNQIWNIKNY